MASPVQLFFRIIYRSFYILLHIIVVTLLLVTPGDLINQSRKRHDIVPIIIVSVSYIASIITVVSVFFIRLFLNRAVLNSIPKSWIPIEKGEVRKNVRDMIATGLSRSAAVAFASRPRIVSEALLDEMCPRISGGGSGAYMSGGGGLGSGGADFDRGAEKEAELGEKDYMGVAAVGEAAQSDDKSRQRIVRFRTAETIKKEKKLGIDLPPCRPVWGKIEHPGWAPPNQPLVGIGHRVGASAGGAGGAGGESAGDGRNGAATGALDEDVTLQYSTVIAELPNLVEAKALALAPPDPTSQCDPPLPDAEAVALLQRPVYMGLREYLAHLGELGVIDLYDDDVSNDGDQRPLSAIVPSFVATYEYARFSTQMLTNEPFRELMHDLATILRRMKALDPSLLLSDSDGGGGGDGGNYTDYSKEGSFTYSEADGRSGLRYYTDDSEGDDIDTNAARSSPTTPPRSRSPRGSAHTYEHFPQDTSQSIRSRSPASRHSTYTSGSGSSGAHSNGTSRRRRPSPRPSHIEQPSTPQQGQLRMPRVRRTAAAERSSRSSSGNSFAQTRNPYIVSSQPSSASLRSTASSGSVIRLADRSEQSLGLPYMIMTPTSRDSDERLF